MTSIPLHCNICPKQPIFSDISHLLTHVGSKGHLSHYFKAQVRSGQDQATRNQLDTYDRWYTDNQIEKLLSQRMILKDSKRPNGTARATKRQRPPSTKPPKVSRAASKKENRTNLEQIPPKADPNNVIDPRLSEVPPVLAQEEASQTPPPSPSSPGLDLISVYRAPVPRMRTFYTSISKPASTTESQNQLLAPSLTLADTEGQSGGSDTESDQDYLVGQSPVKPLYPELPAAEPLPASAQRKSGLLSNRPATGGRSKRGQRNQEDDLATEEDFIPKTPELKGTYYPGMSLFDSANPDAQRKRNQRKNDSLIAQIERESLGVECNEYIYWPDGSLKMCRFITGDVQSSPPKEDTPPPLPKRRRGRKPKGADGAVNKGRPQRAKESRIPQKEDSFAVKRETSLSQKLERPDQSPAMASTFSRAFGRASTRPWIEAEEDEWLLNMGKPVLSHRRYTPLSLEEDVGATNQDGDPIRPIPNPLRSGLKEQGYESGEYSYANELWSNANASKSTSFSDKTSTSLALSTSDLILRPSTRRTTFDSQTPYSFAELEKENIPPPEWDYKKASKKMFNQGVHAQTNHRYTISKGGRDPQISHILPAEMAFAGMATPPVYRISLNPLNPNAHLRQTLPYSSNYMPFEARGLTGHPTHEDMTRQTRQQSVMEEDFDKNFDTETLL
ncbi:MAG: hypothetical protein Q9225_003298 [Loekoesia sp. 1 TL-2023]